MFYCEKCKSINPDPVCEECGKSPLPPATPNDICFVTEQSHEISTMYAEALKARDVPVFSVPSGFSMRTRASAGNKIYVPYQFLDEAIDVFDAIFTPPEEPEEAEESNSPDRNWDES